MRRHELSARGREPGLLLPRRRLHRRSTSRSCQSVYDEIGDFGVASLIATAWATYVQTIQEIPASPTTGSTSCSRADCYSGGWTAALFNGALVGGSLSPGDLDEFVQAFLGVQPGPGRRVERADHVPARRFFRAGFLEGYNACDYDDIVDATADIK